MHKRVHVHIHTYTHTHTHTHTHIHTHTHTLDHWCITHSPTYHCLKKTVLQNLASERSFDGKIFADFFVLFLWIFCFDLNDKWEYAMISVELASPVIVQCDKNFNVAIFLDTMNVMDVNFCMMVLLMELYLFIPLSLTLTKVTRVSDCFKWEFHVLIWLSS